MKQKIVLIFLLILSSCYFSAPIFATNIDRDTAGTGYQDSTSTNYEVKGGAGDPAVGASYSANYIINNGLTMALAVMTMTFPTSTNIGVVTPGISSFAFSTATVSMVGSKNGFNLQVKRDQAASTLDVNGVLAPSIAFPDAVSWDPAGSGNGVLSPGNTLSFRVRKMGTAVSIYNSSWWGASDLSGAAKYAGFPAAAQKIADCAACKHGDFITVLEYQARPSAFQSTGVYSGSITITAIENL